MVYRILKGNTNIKNYCTHLEITTENIEDIFTLEGRKRLIYTSIINNKIVASFGLPSTLLSKIYECVINDTSDKDIQDMLISENVPLFSIIASIINNHKKYYKTLNEFDNAKKIHIECDVDNFIKVLELCQNINVPIVIEGTKISLEQYNNILKKYNIKKLSNKNIKIYYQGYNNSIDIETLYNISIQINYITNKIKKYDLSPLEQILLVFDIVKNNFYIKESDIDNPYLSRTLDNVLNNDYIVCTGYIALINAILKSLGYNSKLLLCNNNKHCRTMINIKDSKYNIDGVYVFDPTFDSKKKDNANYIDNYEYFALPYKVANKTSYTELFSILDLSFISLKKIYNSNIQRDFFEDNINICKQIEVLFSLVDSNYELFIEKLSIYDMLSFIEQEELKGMYNNVVSKYKVEDIDINTFIKAIYKVRRIEYYLSEEEEQDSYSSKLSLPKVDRIDIEGIKSAVTKRYCRIARLSEENSLNSFKLLLYEIGLDSYLSNNLNNILNSSLNKEINRDMLNIQLLKVLKKEKDKRLSQ